MDTLEGKPLVTVYIPTYNRLNLLRRAVKSVLNQDYQNIELIVVDDGSSDGTAEYLMELAGKEARVRYFINQKNSGACVSRNRAIFAANGEFITGLDDDDYFFPNRISLFVAGWRCRDQDTVALFTNSFFKKRSGKVLRTKRKNKVGKVCLFEMNHVGNQVYLPTETIRSIGGFDESLPAWQDYDCWLRVLQSESDSMELVEAASYMVDICHEHPRIGMSSREKKIKAFKIITGKQKINGNALASMKVVLCDATHVSPSMSLVLSKIMFRKNKRNVVFAIKVISKSLIYGWPAEKEVFLD